ncbi:tandem-95 repeat protein [Desmonostoc muscorum CCALA 125]|nr:tandem-95 repeat protein [Desmonostoc muscorum CCALA 125]
MTTTENGITPIINSDGISTGVFVVSQPIDQLTPVGFKLSSYDASYITEFGVFKVDDDLGTIQGVKPGDPNYAFLALSTADRRSLISAYQPVGTVYENYIAKGGERLVFYVAPNSTANTVQTNNPANTPQIPSLLFSTPIANPDKINHVKLETFSDGITQLAWEDLLGGGDRDFNDMVIQVQLDSAISEDTSTPQGGQTQQTPTGELIGSAKVAAAALEVQPNSQSKFAIVAEGTLTINGGGDFDGLPLDPTDDALIHAAKGFTLNNTPVLPVQRDSNGNPILGQSGKPLLVDNALTVAAGYQFSNANNNPYGNLLPPQVVQSPVVNIPNYADLKQQELNRRVPTGTPTIVFNVAANPINNARDWNLKFPPPVTGSQPQVVRVTNGGLTIPNGIDLSNYVIIVEQGDINFNGSGHDFTNVMLITNNGNINLAAVHSTNLAVFASGSINMNNQARFGDFTLLATGSTSSSINFNGATTTTQTNSNLRIISQGDIQFNGSSQTRGALQSRRNIIFDGQSTLYGTVEAKGNIIFNGQATVFCTTIASPDTTPPVISANLARDTAPSGTTNSDRITFDPTITGQVTDNSAIVEFKAGFDNTPSTSYVNVLPDLSANGSFIFSRARLEQIYGATLPDGVHTLHLQAKDQYNNLSTSEFTFTLDTKLNVSLSLDPAFDTAPVGDNQTTLSIVAIAGQTEPGITLTLSPGVTTTADATGKFVFENVELVLGDNLLQVQGIDVAGNQTTTGLTIKRLPPPNQAPIIADITKTVNEDSVLTLSATDFINAFSDANGDSLSQIRITNLPNNGVLQFNGVTVVPGQEILANQLGNLTFTPAANFNGTVSFNWNATDGVSYANTDAVLTITVAPLNDAPTELALSPTVTLENVPSNTKIGNFSTTDIDVGDTFTYSLVTGTGSTDNAAFTIVNDELRIKASPDFETKSAYSIRVKTTDEGGSSFEQVFAINVTNVNEAPTALTLSSNTIAENVASNSLIGTLSTTDPDVSDTFTYSLVTGTGDDDNAAFVIVDNELRISQSPDFETKSAYSIRVRTTDAGGLSFEQVFAITITNVNEAPIFTSTAVTNADTGSAYTYTITTADPDTGDTRVLSAPTLPTWLTFIDNGDGTAILSGTPTVSAAGANQVVLQVTDAGGLKANQSFTITVIAANLAPTALSLTPTAVNENVPVNTKVGTFSTVDPNTGDTFTYSLVTGTGSTDNSAFTIVSDELRLQVSPDYEIKNSYSIRVKTTDQGGLSFESPFTVTVNDIFNENPPSNIQLSNNLIAENSPNLTIIGELSTTDLDVGQTHTYTLINDAGGRFTLFNGKQLAVANGNLLDYETNTSHTIRIRTTDSGIPSLSFEKDFTINVGNVNEAPIFTSNPDPSNPQQSGDVGELYRYNIATSDPENHNRTLTAVLANSANPSAPLPLPSWLTFTDNGDGTGVLSGTPGVTDAGLYTVVVTATDNPNPPLAPGSLSSTQTVFIGTNIILREQTNFSPNLTTTFTVPQTPSTLSFKVQPVAPATSIFDSTDPNSINDAFEVELLDTNGKSLVHTFAANKTSFFNLTEGEPVGLGAGTTYNAATGVVTLNLTGINPTQANLRFRLVNNDTDTASAVLISNLTIAPAPVGSQAPVQTAFTDSTRLNQPINFSEVANVTPSIAPQYGKTTFDAKAGLLYADVALKNVGSYAINGSLLLAVKNISDPTVQLRDPDGLTPDGLPYYDFSKLVADGKLDPTELSAVGSLVFYNPNQVQFTYKLEVLSVLNHDPVIITAPVKEAIASLPYQYDVDATDADSDTLTYKLLTAPNGMAINADTGLITWTPNTANVGNQQIKLEVSDGRGGIAEQEYTLAVITTPPNRPPIFTSFPEVDAYINKLYSYDANAVDPDQDPINFSLIIGPNGMTVNPDTGLVQWTPPAALVLGDTVLGRIGIVGEKDEFTFSGTSGERIYFDSLQYSGDYYRWNLSVYSPSGQQVLNADLRDNNIITLQENGNYRVVVDTTGDFVGTYGFSTINLGLVTVVPFDTVIQGKLTPGSQDDTYRFRGAQGQKLFFDRISASGNLDWVLYNEDNQVVTSSGFSDLELYLPKDGEYTLALRGREAFTSQVDYSFEIITPDEITQPMSLGSINTPNVVSGEITEKGEEDFYTFTGTAGQRIYFDRLFQNPTGSYSLNARLYNPTGQEILERNFQYGDDPEPIILNENGTYRVRIDGSGENTGTYSFSILDLSLATAINLDTTYTTTLDPGQETHLYSFTGAANQRLFLDRLNNSGNANWTLYDSGNNVLSNQNLAYDMEVVLSRAETYTLAIRGNNNTNAVNYSFRLITPDTITSPLTLNSAVVTTISEKGERDVYTFTGTKGQRLFLDTLAQTTNTRATLTSPSGINVINDRPMYNDTWYDPVILLEDGVYNLTIDGYEESTDSYGFRLVDVTAAPSLTAETLTTGTINPGNAIQFYQFTGNTGDRVYFDSQATVPNTNWHLYSPDNRELYETGLSSDFEYVLAGSGTYYLMLRGENATATNYSIQLVTTTSPATAYTLNTLTTGNITKLGEQDTYSFDGTAGQVLYFDPQSGSSNITAKIYSPRGALIFDGNTSTDSPNLTLLETGSYQIVFDGYSDTIGAYSFRVATIAAQSALTLGSAFTGSLAAQETKLYTINGSKGQQLAFDSLAAVSGADWVLYAPSTQPTTGTTVLGSAGLGSDFTRVLPSDGTYILALRNNSASAVNFNVQVNSTVPSAVVNSGLGVLYNSTLSVGGEVDEYTFTAKAGTLVFLDGQGNDSQKRVRLYNPSGTAVFDNADNQADYGPYLLQESGTYRIQAYGSPTTTGAYKFQLLDLEAASALSLNTVTNVPLAAKETKAYKFTGAVGQKIWFDALNTAFPNITARLYNPNGYQIYAQGDLRNDIGLQTITQSGTYYLVLSSDNTAAATASFRVLDNTAATNLTLDTVVSGNFGTNKNEAILYNFTGTKGDRLYFDRTDGSYYNFWRLQTPDGAELLTQRLSYDFELVLPSSGEYILSLYSYGDSSSTYSFKVVTPTPGTAAYTIGSTVSGTIGEAGEQDTYTFTGTAGQRLWFDSLFAADGRIQGKLYSPTTVELWNTALSSDREFTTLIETGTYSFVVDSTDEFTGNYSFRFLDEAAATSTTLDTAITGDFGTSQREARIYSFTGTQGQSIYFDSDNSDYYNLYYFYAPGTSDGQRLFAQRLSYDQEGASTVLPTTGKYTLVFAGFGGTDNTYNLQMVTPTFVTTALTLGSTVNGTISEPGEQDTYTFTGSKGQQLWFDSLLYSDYRIRATLYTPSGKTTTWNNFLIRDDQEITVLDEAGTYRLVIDADNDFTGNYSFRILDTASATPVNLDADIAGNFGTTQREAKTYSFTGTKGQKLYFDSDNSDYYNYYYVYNTNGKRLFSQHLSYDYEAATLPDNGKYTLVVAGYERPDNDFNLRIVTPTFVTTPYTIGSTVSSSITEAGEQDTYTFTSSKGQQLWFDSLLYSDYRIRVKLYDTNGDEVFNQYVRDDREPVTLAEQGTYRLVIDGDDDFTGAYSFRLLDFATAPILTLDTPVTGNFGTSQREALIYRFNGIQGQHIYFDRTEGEFYNYYYLYSPNGQRLFSQYFDRDQELDLPENGQYTVVFSGNERPNNNFGITVVTPQAITTALTLGSKVTNSISEAGEQDTYTFTGAVGQKLFFDALTGNGNLRARLYGPSNDLLVDRDTNSDWPLVTLFESGNYRLVVDGYDNITGNYSFTLSDLAQVQPLTFGTPVTNTLEPGNSVALYRFDGTPGKIIKFDLTAASWTGANWVLYDPTGRAVETPSASSPDFTTGLSAAGSYTLAIVGNSATSVPYSFQVNDVSVAPVTSSGLGVVRQGTLAAGAVDEYTFTTNAGTLVLLDSLNDSNSLIRARLLNPDGTYVFSDHDSRFDRGPILLEQTGTYKLQIFGYYTTSSGAYKFNLLELPKRLGGPGVSYLELGSPVSGSLTGLEDKVYTFQAVNGLRAMFNGMTGDNVAATLYNSSGTQIFNSSNFRWFDNGLYTLTQNDYYYLVISNEQAANRNYSFQLLDSVSSPELLENIPQQGSLASGQQGYIYRFNANAGERIFVDNLSTNAPDGNYRWKIYSPNNSVLDDDFQGYDLEVASISQTGEYLLYIQGGPGTAAINYNFRVSTQKPNATDVITPGIGLSSSTDDGSLGLFPVKLAVKDNKGGSAIQEYKIRLWPDPDNSSPVIISTADTKFGLDEKGYTYQLKAIDPDQDALVYRLIDSPTGALINSDTGELLWFPESTVKAGDQANFTVEVSDRRGGKDVQKFTVDVYAALGKIQGAVFDDLNGNGLLDSKLVKGIDPAIVFAIDVSGSTEAPFHGKGEYENVKTVLDAEVAAALAMVDAVIAQGAGNTVKFGIIPHQISAVIQDMDPVTSGIQSYTTALADKDNNGISDIKQILQSYTPNGSNNFTTALSTIDTLFSQALSGTPNLIFMSDGYGPLDATVATNVAKDIKDRGGNVTAFAIGEASTLSTLQKIDPEAIKLTDIEELVNLFLGFDPRYAIEPFVNDVTVYLDVNNNGVFDNSEPYQITKQDTTPNPLGVSTKFYFTFDDVLPGNYTVRTVVPSGYTLTAPPTGSFADTVTVNGENYNHLFGISKVSTPPNQNPVFTTTPPALTTLKAGELLKYNADAQDPDADRLTYSLVLAPEGMTVDQETGNVIWNPTKQQVEKYYADLKVQQDRLNAIGRGAFAPTVVEFNVLLTVKDGRGGQALQYLNVQLLPENAKPVFTSTFPDDAKPQVGKQFTYQATATDPDGDALTFEVVGLPTGAIINTSTGLLTWTPTAGQLGDRQFTIKVKDGKGGESLQVAQAIVINPVANNLPVITSTPRTSTRLGNSYFYEITATDVDGDALTYSLQTAPTGMTIAKNVIAWTPAANQSGNTNVVLKVTDSQGGSTNQSFTINVGYQAANLAPVITSAPDFVTNLEQEYQYDLKGNDPDGDRLIWSLDNAPSGMVLDPTTGALRWQPKSTQIGDYTVAIRLSDNYGLYVGQEYTLTVTGANTPPLFVSNPNTRAGVGQKYTYSVVAKDAENDVITYTLNRRPADMTIDANGQIEWTPQAAGTYEIEVQARDAQGAAATQAYKIEVGTTAINQAPTIASTPKYVAILGSAYSYDVDATDPEGGALTYQLINNGGATGLAINATTGLLTWATPVAGNYQVVVGAVDAQGLGAAQGFTLTARANAPAVIRSTPITTASPDQLYRYDVQASDPEGGKLTYKLDTTSVGKGIVIDDQGRVSWTPKLAQVGTHNIVLTVTDDAGATTQQSYNLVVAADNTAPQVKLQFAGFNPTNLGSQITFRAQATDNVKVANLQLLVGGTPVALDAFGQATVKLNTAGNINIIARATDGAGNVKEDAVVITVIDPSQPANAPEVALDLDRIANGVITKVTDIFGQVTDTDDNLKDYVLEVAPIGTDNWITMFKGSAEVASSNSLGKFDPTFIADGTYQVRLTATDDTGLSSSIGGEIDVVSGQLKLGEFKLSFTDLEIIVGSLPITLRRTYDSLALDATSDVAPGWALDYQNVDLRTSLGKDQSLIDYGIPSNAFDDRTKVYITIPGLERQVFEFEPVGSRFNRFFSDPSANLYIPRFKAVGSTSSTLTISNAESDSSLVLQDPNGKYRSLSGLGYDPANSYFNAKYVLTTKDGKIYQIDPTTGNIETVTTPQGEKLTYTDAFIQSSFGPKVTFKRDAQGRITSVVDPDGKEIKYTYDAKGDLVAVTDRGNNTTKFEYNSTKAHYLDRIIDPLNREVARTEYDDQGRLKTYKNAAGNAIAFTYDPNLQKEVITDGLGHPTTYFYDERGNTVSTIDALGYEIKSEYDSNNNLTKQTDQLGNVSTYKYDSNGYLSQETDLLGYTTTFVNDANGRVTSATDPNGNVTKQSFSTSGLLNSATDYRGNLSKYTYNANGSATSLGLNGAVLYKMDYNSQGLLASNTDANGGITKYTYNSAGNIIQSERIVTTVNGSTQSVITKTEYDDNGRIIANIDSLGRTNRFEYDASGRKTADIDAAGNRREYTYDLAGNLTKLKDYNGYTETYTYDAAGRQTSITDDQGQTVKFEYDALGRTTKVTFPDGTSNTSTYDAVGNPLKVTYSNGTFVEQKYDALGNVLEQKNQLGEKVSYTYNKDGSPATFTDAQGGVTKYVYDTLGNLIETIYPDGTKSSNSADNKPIVPGTTITTKNAVGYEFKIERSLKNQITAIVAPNGDRASYAYDELGNLIQETDFRGKVTKYEYDTAGRRTARILPQGQREEFTYNEFDELVSAKDFAGQVFNYTYDDVGNLIKSDLPDNTSVKYDYGTDGTLSQVTDASGTVTFTYDSLGRVIKQTNPDGRAIEYGYDSFGRTNLIKTAAGTTNYLYSDDGLLESITDSRVGVTSFTYYENGLLKTKTLPNGVVETYTWDNLGLLAKIEQRNAANALISSYSYQRDAIGNVIKIDENVGLASQSTITYTYDALNRLTTENIDLLAGNDRIITYTYDGAGNRLQRNDSLLGITTYIYGNNNQLSSETIDGVTTSYTYDANGNRLTAISPTLKVFYQWNTLNLLVGLTQKDVNDLTLHQYTYSYDSQGNRISQVVDGLETKYLLDYSQPYVQVREEYRGNTITAAYINDGTQSPLVRLQSGSAEYYLGDRQDSTKVLTDASGAVTQRYTYDAYGRILQQTGTSNNQYLYAGEQYDKGTGLQYLRSRYNDLNAGSFISRDTYEGEINDPSSRNQYVYAKANPVAYVDPSGYFTLGEFSASQTIQDILNGLQESQRIFTVLNFEDKINFWSTVLFLSGVTIELFASYIQSWPFGGVVNNIFGTTGGSTSGAVGSPISPFNTFATEYKIFKPATSKYLEKIEYGWGPGVRFNADKGGLSNGSIGILFTGFFGVEGKYGKTKPPAGSKDLAQSGVKVKVGFTLEQSLTLTKLGSTQLKPKVKVFAAVGQEFVLNERKVEAKGIGSLTLSKFVIGFELKGNQKFNGKSFLDGGAVEINTYAGLTLGEAVAANGWGSAIGKYKFSIFGIRYINDTKKGTAGIELNFFGSATDGLIL